MAELQAFRVFERYTRGKTSLRELRQAAALLEAQSKAGNIACTFALAVVLSDADTPLFSRRKARRLFEQCWKAGDAHAAYLLTQHPFESLWPPPRPISSCAMKWLVRAAGVEHPEAMYNLATLLLSSERPEAIRESRGLLTRSSRLGDHRSTTLLCLLDLSRQSSKSRTAALRRLSRIAFGGCPEAMNALGWWRAKSGGNSGIAIAVGLWRKAAARGCAAAMWNLAICYDRGTGVTMSRIAAHRWLRKANQPKAFRLHLCDNKGNPWWMPTLRLDRVHLRVRPLFDPMHGFACSDVPGVVPRMSSIVHSGA